MPKASTQYSPAASAVSITPHDTNVIPGGLVRGLYIGGATGNITCILADDTTSILFENVVPGTVIPIMVTHILATGTTATNIVGLR